MHRATLPLLVNLEGITDKAFVVMAGERKGNAAFALAELLSRRELERPCGTLVAWARQA